MFYILIMSLIAGFASYNYMFKPMLEDAISSGTNNVFTNDQLITLSVLSVLAAIIAPVTIVVLLVPEFRNQVYNTLSTFINQD